MCVNTSTSAYYELEGFHSSLIEADCISNSPRVVYTLSKDYHLLLSLGFAGGHHRRRRPAVIISGRLRMWYSW